MVNYEVGHEATYREEYGGLFTKISLKWLDWQLKGLKSNASFFYDEDYLNKQFPEGTLETKNL